MPSHRIVRYCSRFLEGNYIDKMVRQWLICAITHCNIPISAFFSSQSDVQLLTIDQRLHGAEWSGSINSFHPIEFQPIAIDIWHMFPRDICLPSGSWLTGWQFVCEKGRKSVKSAYEFVLIPNVKKKEAMFSPPHLNLACTVACWPLSTCSHSTLFWPYFLLIIMWIIKVQVH